MTSCNRCGAIGHWEEDCTQPARSRKKSSPLQRAKEKVVGSGERNLMVKDEKDGWKNQTSQMKVLLGYAVLDCGAAKSLCGAKLVAQMAQACAREGKRVEDKRDAVAIFASYHFR